MSLQSQFKSKVLLEKIEPLTVIKNEPLTVIKNELEIGMDQDIINSDIKDEIDIEYHLLSEDLIKNEPIPNNVLESEHLGSAETQIFVQTENTPFLKTEFENLVKTEDTSNENLCVEEIQKRKAKLKIDELPHKTEKDNRHLKYHCDQCTYRTFYLGYFKRHKLRHLKPERIRYFYCYYCSFKSKHKSSLQRHIFRHFKNEEVPFHCYICDFVTQKRDFIVKHFKKHPEHRSICDETEYKNQLETCHYEKLNLYELTQHLKYRCDKCTYRTFYLTNFKTHKVTHLKPEEISYFYCYHCSYKCKQKSYLKVHIFRHFKNEEVLFHCYICDFVTVKRDLIIKHFKKHPKYRSKYDETDYKISLNLVKESFRYCCKKCTFRTYQYEKFKLHELTHKEMDDRYLKYQCDKCTYKTFNKRSFEVHQLIHLKPEEIQYFYCYHCPYKCIQKNNLKVHILRHFKREEVPFHCYICDFVTRKRDLIIEHFKKHPEHVSKCDETDYQISLLKLTPKIKKK